jgi:hypothetical protein
LVLACLLACLLACCGTVSPRRIIVVLCHYLHADEVTGMDPITLIVTALAAGAALGLQDTASAMVKDA